MVGRPETKQEGNRYDSDRHHWETSFEKELFFSPALASKLNRCFDQQGMIWYGFRRSTVGCTAHVLRPYGENHIISTVAGEKTYRGKYCPRRFYSGTPM